MVGLNLLSVSVGHAGKRTIPSSMGELADGLVHEMANDLKGKKVYFDRTTIVDVMTTNAAPFSVYLADSLDGSLAGAFDMVLQAVEADFILRVSYQRGAEDVMVTCNYFNVKEFVAKSVARSIPLDRLPGDAFEENLRSKAYKLAAVIIGDTVKQRVYLQPIREAVDGYVSEFSAAFGLLLKSELTRLHAGLDLVDEAVVDPSTEPETFEEGTGEDVELERINAQLAGADSILRGEYFLSSDHVIVSLFLEDLDGRILNSVTEEIDRGLITQELVDESYHKLADYADKASEDKEKIVKISPTKGGDNPIYHHKDIMAFYLQVVEPLYIYLYDIDPTGNVTRLFPNTPEQENQLFQAGKLYTYPDGQDGVELEVNPPFGKDVIKVFASSKPLPLPEFDESAPLKGYDGETRAIKVKRKEIQEELATVRSIHPKDLVDYYRGVATEKGVSLHENSIFIETRE